MCIENGLAARICLEILQVKIDKGKQNAATKNPDRSEASLETMMRYYDQILSLEMKIPANEVQIPFKWKNAFDKGSIFGGRISLTVPNLGYEKVSKSMG